MLSNLLLSFLVFSLSLFPPVLPVFAAPLGALQYQSEGSRPPHLSKLDLEQWYQELMAGSGQLCTAPPLPAKSLSGRRPVLQVQGLSFLSLHFFSYLFLCCFCICHSSASLQHASTHMQGNVC